MKIELNLNSDSYNTYCNNEKLVIEVFNDEDDRENLIWIEIGDRKVSVNKNEFKKLMFII